MIRAGTRPIGMISVLCAIMAFFAVALSPSSGSAQSFAFKQAVAEAVAGDEALTEFYKAREFKPLWTSNRDGKRRKAFLKALEEADMHGLPTARYDAAELRRVFRDANSPRARGFADATASRMFLTYAQDIQSGALVPSRVDPGIVRKLPRRDRLQQITAFSKSSPSGFIKKLPPQRASYTRLLRAKMDLEKAAAAGGWGAPVKGKKIEPGASGDRVVALRNRLIRMGYLKRSNSATYDSTLQKAVMQFQSDNGLSADGVVAKGTMAELNKEPEDRLKSVIVGLERERYMNRNLGNRRVMVNIPDFHARVIENDREVFRTRVVVGKNTHDRRTPEFSDEMEHLVINPTWNVPRSIATKEYLPKFQNNPNAHGYLRLVDSRGRVVSRENVDFTMFNERNFPFDLKQPPSNRNALGLVKFMFPNQHNIYLHDTPQKALFARESRGYSHGCIRVADPFDLAYELLSKQQGNPKGYFQSTLSTGRETTVPLDANVPVHLYYQTAFAPAKGNVQYRRDVYNRDDKLWKALSDAGVALPSVRG